MEWGGYGRDGWFVRVYGVGALALFGVGVCGWSGAPVLVVEYVARCWFYRYGDFAYASRIHMSVLGRILPGYIWLLHTYLTYEGVHFL